MSPRKLIVNWQDDATRSILPVAELIEVNETDVDRFEFGYLEGVRSRARRRRARGVTGDGERVA